MKPLWQNVEQEAPDKLVGGECHCAVPRRSVAAVILVAEGAAPELKFRIQSPPAVSQQTFVPSHDRRRPRGAGRPRRYLVFQLTKNRVFRMFRVEQIALAALVIWRERRSL